MIIWKRRSKLNVIKHSGPHSPNNVHLQQSFELSETVTLS